MSLARALTAPRAFPRAAGWAWALAALAGVALFALLRSPAAEAAALAPPACAFHALTGHACATCGMTRALVALAHGAWRESLAFHPWALPLVAQAVGAWLAWGAWLAGALPARPDRFVPRLVALNALALLVVWGLRAALGALPA